MFWLLPTMQSIAVTRGPSFGTLIAVGVAVTKRQSSLVSVIFKSADVADLSNIASCL